jgi:hypothetical protein
MLASKCTLNPTHPGRLASATPPLKMEGNCFSEKQRVFVILPKERPWRISADRNTFGGYPISAGGTPFWKRISQQPIDLVHALCHGFYFGKKEQKPAASLLVPPHFCRVGNAMQWRIFARFEREPNPRLASATPPLKMDTRISADRHTFGGYPISSARNAHGGFLPRERHLVDFAIRFRYSISLFDFAIRFRYSLYSLFAIRFLPIGTPLVDFCR